VVSFTPQVLLYPRGNRPRPPQGKLATPLPDTTLSPGKSVPILGTALLPGEIGHPTTRYHFTPGKSATSAPDTILPRGKSALHTRYRFTPGGNRSPPPQVPLYPQENYPPPRYPLDSRLGGPQTQSRRRGGKKNLTPAVQDEARRYADRAIPTKNRFTRQIVKRFACWKHGLLSEHIRDAN
jgi:hypothetical protein